MQYPPPQQPGQFYQPPQYGPPYQQPPQWSPQPIQMQQERNYTPAAWLSAVLSVFLLVPGLIATLIYLVEANNVKKRTGITPQGYGCLWAVLIWCALPLVFIGGFVFLLLISAASMGH